MLILTVDLSTASTLVILAGYCVLMPGGGGFSWALMPHTTSSTVMSEPSWNFTPGRSLKTYVLSPGADHSVASAGCSFRLRSQAIKESYMNSLPQWFWVGTAPYGIRCTGSESSAQVTLPPRIAPVAGAAWVGRAGGAARSEERRV